MHICTEKEQAKKDFKKTLIAFTSWRVESDIFFVY